jgi:hypothetical protein
MKVRWREHELILVTILATVILARYWWDMQHATMQQLAAPFTDHHIAFNIYRNVLLPDIGLGLGVYLSYLFLNFFTIRRLTGPRKIEAGSMKITMTFAKIELLGLARKVLEKYAWLAIQLVLLVLVMGACVNAANYYRNEYLFKYPGFTFFPGNGYHLRPLMDVTAGFRAALAALLLYALYIGVREGIIHFIETAGRKRAYLTLIVNQVTGFLVVYIIIPFAAAVFRLVHGGDITTMYFSFVIPVFLVYMSNMYWLFPVKGERSFFTAPVMLRLLASTFLCSVPFLLSPFHEGYLFNFPVCWAIQVVIVTPLTWLLYQQRKDKIIQLRGAQRELVRSKADLQFLRSQINPHFLFNVLNTLYGAALQENAEHTAAGIQKLGDMMRFMLHENSLPFIQMDREIEYLKNYIALQKLRTQSSPEISIEDNIGEQDCHHQIAPMLLIPFVENAFKHGISLKEESWIKISLQCTGKEIFFEVRNSMHPQLANDPEKERSGIGFKNVLERLKLIYPGKHRFSVNGDGKEFFVQLSIEP